MIDGTQQNTERVLNVERRVAVGTRAVRRLRAGGKIPAIVYGHTTPVAISIDRRTFLHNFYPISENTIIRLRIGDASHDVLVKDYDFDARTDEVLHIDFFEIEKGKVFKTHVPLVVSGSSPGVRQGGVLEQPLHHLEVECLPRHLPKEISIDISSLEINHSLHVSEVALPAGVRVLNSSEQVLVHVVTPKVEKASSVDEPEAEETEGEAEQ